MKTIRYVALTLFFLPLLSHASNTNTKNNYDFSMLYGVNFLSPYTFTSKQVSPGQEGKASFKPGFFTEIALSRHLNPNWSFGLLGEYQNNAAKDSQLAGKTLQRFGQWTSYSLLLNPFFFPLPQARFSPFVGAGIGASIVSVEDTSYNKAFYIDDSQLDFVWQVELGAQTRINDYLSFIAEIQHFEIQLRHDETNSYQTRQYKNTALSVGFAYDF